jgi:hypothetical protein
MLGRIYHVVMYTVIKITILNKTKQITYKR